MICPIAKSIYHNLNFPTIALSSLAIPFKLLALNLTLPLPLEITAAAPFTRTISYPV